MWSMMADIDLIRDWRFAFSPNHYQVEKTYVRTIRNFWLKDDYKRRRHAWRLFYNLADLKQDGIFNPTMSPERVEEVSALARDGVPPPIPLETSSHKDVDTPFHLR